MAADNTYNTKIQEQDGGDTLVVAAGGTVEFNGGVTMTTDASGNLILTGLPTADPAVAGALWSNAGVLTVSAG